MGRPIQQMTVAELADLLSRFGAPIARRNGHFWRRVRPFFYRPLFPFEVFDQDSVQRPCRWPGAYQYLVQEGKPSNSTLNFIMLDDVHDYSLAKLGHKRRQLINFAARRFQIRPIENVQELRDQGYKAYLSFYDRTRYSYRSDRRDQAAFNQWPDMIYHHPKAALLGGYGERGLVAVLCLYWVEGTLVCASLFCDTESQRERIGELLLHEIRQLAAGQPGIRDIYVRSYQGGNSLDRYYLLRGCKLVRKPAWLEIPSGIHGFIRRFMPGNHALLSGAVSADDRAEK